MSWEHVFYRKDLPQAALLEEGRSLSLQRFGFYLSGPEHQQKQMQFHLEERALLCNI